LFLSKQESTGKRSGCRLISLLDGLMGWNNQCIKIQQILHGWSHQTIKGCLVGCKYIKCGHQSHADLIFPETKVDLDMSGAMTLLQKIQDKYLSTGSISTFHTTMTRASQAARKSISWVKTNKGNDASTTDTNSVYSLVTISENGLSILLA